MIDGPVAAGVNGSVAVGKAMGGVLVGVATGKATEVAVANDMVRVDRGSELVGVTSGASESDEHAVIRTTTHATANKRPETERITRV